MTAVEQSTEGFKTRIVSTFNYSLLPFFAIPNFFSHMISITNSAEEKNEEISNFVIMPFSYFMGVMGTVFLAAIGLLTLALGALAVVAQTIFLPVQLIKSAIDDSYSTSIPEDGEKNTSVFSDSSIANSEVNTMEKTSAAYLSEFYGKLFDHKPVVTEDDDMLLREIESKYLS